MVSSDTKRAEQSEHSMQTRPCTLECSGSHPGHHARHSLQVSATNCEAERRTELKERNSVAVVHTWEEASQKLLSEKSYFGNSAEKTSIHSMFPVEIRAVLNALFRVGSFLIDAYARKGHTKRVDTFFPRENYRFDLTRHAKYFFGFSK